MMRGPYNKSSLAKKIGGNRNRVYEIMKELEDTRTVYLKYVMGPHYSLVPIVAFGKGESSNLQRFAQAFPFSILYFLSDVENQEKYILAFYRVPPKYVSTVGRRIKAVNGIIHFGLDLDYAETSPRYLPYFSKGTWKLKPLPRPENTLQHS